jgi:diketogulonate reductase-like aldo/keto reductase
MFPIEDNGLYSSDNASHYVDTWHAMEELVDAGLVR